MTTTKEVCSFCRQPRAIEVCEVCNEFTCSKCMIRHNPESLEALTSIPIELEAVDCCPRCYDAKVQPALDAYNEVLERAKAVGYWSKAYRGHVPVLEKGRIEVAVQDGKDREDVIYKLGYLAAEQGFNGLINGVVDSKKVRDHAYSKMVWSGKALPCRVDMEKLDREEYREAHWRVLHHR